jgi:hypothetical protein
MLYSKEKESGDEARLTNAREELMASITLKQAS